MKSFLQAGLIKKNVMITNPELKEEFQSSKKDNNFIVSSCPNSPRLSDTQSNLSLNTSSPTSTNPSVESFNSFNDSSLNETNKSIIIIKKNFNYCDLNENKNNERNKNNDQKNKNIFLGNKRKIQFNVKKIDKKSPIFITSNENSKFDLSNFALNNSNMNKNSLNIPNVDTTESTLLSKETEKKPLPKKVKPHLFNTINYDFFENLINKNINEGRWSSDEHIRFLRAYINFGKKYKLSQKYIGSRNSMQIRSHAQKFFLKLKNLKNEQFDFTTDNIKNLLDVFELIKANNKTNIDNKEYIVNTLIELCKNTPKNELNSSKGDIRIIIDKKEGENAFNDLLFNKENSLKTDIFNETFNNKFNIESESSIFEDEEINNDNDMIILNIDRNENENIKQNELDIDRSYEQNRKNLNRNNDFGVNEQKYCNKDINININYDQNLKFDNDYIFVSGDSDIFSKEEIPAKENDFMIVKNSQSPYLKFICNYFS